jgi:uncharacterized protein with PhoU and TrkA domain
MEDRPRNLKAMLAAAKDASELMVDLAYASLYFGDHDMAEEVAGLEEDLSGLVHDMRAICVVAARSPRDADAMASVLQVIGAIERMGNAAVDISRIVTRRLGIPRALVADLSAAEEGSHIAHRPLSALELPTRAGMRVVAIRRGRSWNTDVGGDEVLVPGDVLFLQGAREGIAVLRSLTNAPEWEPPQPEGTVTELDRAIDILVEMKNISEVAVGLAYSALVLRDRGLATEVNHLEDRLDQMRERLESWVLRAAADHDDPSPLRGLLHLSRAAEEIGDAAQQMVWLIEKGEELHPVLALALGDADEVVVRVPVAPASQADGQSLGALRLETETGFFVLAIRRGGRYFYRPRPDVVLRPDDEIIATGPDEGHALLAERCGFRLVEDEDTGEDELVRV